MNKLILACALTVATSFQMSISEPPANEMIQMGGLRAIVSKIGVPTGVPLNTLRVCFGILGSKAPEAHNCTQLDKLGNREGQQPVRFMLEQTPAPAFATVEFGPRCTEAIREANVYAVTEERSNHGSWRQLGDHTLSPVRIFDNRKCATLQAAGSVELSASGEVLRKITSNVAFTEGVSIHSKAPAAHSVLQLGALHQILFDIKVDDMAYLPGSLGDWRVCYGLKGSHPDTDGANPCFSFDNFGKVVPMPVRVAMDPSEVSSSSDVLNPRHVAARVIDHPRCGGLDGLSRLPNATLYFQLEHWSAEASLWTVETDVSLSTPVHIYDESACDKHAVLVTGGSGLVGRAVHKVITDLKQQGLGHGGSLAGSPELAWAKSAEWIFLDGRASGDLRDPGEVEAMFEKWRPTRVLHLAAAVEASHAMSKDHAQFWTDNAKINDNVLAAAAKLSLRRSLPVNVVSCLSSTMLAEQPASGVVDEKALTSASRPHPHVEGYAYSKRLLERLSMWYSTQGNFPLFRATTVMPANIFGPAGDYTDGGPLLNALVGKALRAKAEGGEKMVVLGSGQPRRQMLYSLDFARILIAAVEHYEDATEPLIAAGSEERTIRSLVELVAETAGFQGKISNDLSSPDGPLFRTASTAKLARLFPGLKATPLERAVLETVEWAVSNPARITAFADTTAPPSSLQSLPEISRGVQTALGGPRVLWSSDFHIATIADLKSLFEPFDVTIVDKSLSEHCHLKGTCESDLKVLNRSNGLKLTPCPNELRRAFFEAYLSDPEMEKVDAFVCLFSGAMCELFMPFDRPLIIIAPTRYEVGRDLPSERWVEWNDNLKRIADNPRNILAANNFYDAKYIEHFTGIENVLVLPSACDYTGATYAPTRREILVGPGRGVHEALFQELRSTAAQSATTLEFATVRSLYEHFEYTDLASHPAIVLIPYQVSIMSIFEYYRMGLPMFVPSQELLTKWQLEHFVMPERTWHGAAKSWSNSLELSPSPGSNIGAHANASHPHLDPNSEWDPVALAHWLQYCDFYQWPHVTQFDSFSELITKLESLSMSKLHAISANMSLFNDEMLKNILLKWQTVFQKTFDGVPPLATHPRPLAPSLDFDTSLALMYGAGLSENECPGPARQAKPPHSAPVCFERVQAKLDVLPTTVPMRGDVSSASSFGATLFGLVKRMNVTRVLDIGSGFGGGTTQIISDAIQDKAKCVDVNTSYACCDAFVVAIEMELPAHKYATAYHRGNPVWVVHGKAMETRHSMGEPLVQNICDSMRGVDLVVMDSTGFEEFDLIRSACSPWFIAVRDDGTSKAFDETRYLNTYQSKFEVWSKGKDLTSSWVIFETREEAVRRKKEVAISTAKRHT